MKNPTHVRESWTCSFGFWNPPGGFQIAGTGSRSALSVKVGLCILIVSAIPQLLFIIAFNTGRSIKIWTRMGDEMVPFTRSEQLPYYMPWRFYQTDYFSKAAPKMKTLLITWLQRRYVLNNAKRQILPRKTVQTPLVDNRIIKSTCMIFLKFLFWNNILPYLSVSIAKGT